MTEEEKKHQEIEDVLTGDFRGMELPGGVKIEIPPKVFIEMEGRFLDYERKKSLTVSFPIPERYANPMGVMQGGIITAAFDNTFGPLSFLVARSPTTTLALTTNYIRSIGVGDRLTIKARVVGRGFDTMHMSAEAWNSKNKMVATATTNMYFLKIPGS